MREIDYRFKFLSFIGILCVVCGHIGLLALAPDRLFIYDSFHMPLFFFISGYFFRREIRGFTQIKDYILKKGKKMLMPLWGWTFVYLLFCMLMRKQSIIPFQRGIATFGLRDVIIGPFEWIAHSRMNIAAWFVGTLFIVEVVHVLVWSIMRPKWKESLAFYSVFLAIGCIGIWIGKNGLPGISNNAKGLLARTLYCWFWYESGVWYKSHFEKVERRIPNELLFSFVVVSEIILSLLHLDTGIASGVYNAKFPLSIFETILTATIAILFWLRVAVLWGEKWIQKTPKAMLIADHTFDIMMHHGFAVWLVSALIYVVSSEISIFSNFDVKRFAGSDWYTFIPVNGAVIRYVYLAACIVVPICISGVMKALCRLLKK